MDWLADKWIFLLMFSGYTAILIRHAIEGNKKTRNVTDYFIGGRSLGGITIGLSFCLPIPAQTALSVFPDRPILTELDGYW